MITEEVATNIYRIPVNLPDNPLRVLNSYLIKDAKRSLLIDTGFRLDECKADLLAGLAELREDPSKVDIFVTHMHADHTGNAMDIVGKDRSVTISAIDKAWMTGDDAAQTRWNRNTATLINAGMELDDAGFMPHLTRRNQGPPQNAHEYVGVEDGHVFHVGGRALRCVLTPGHTPGHMCLWDADEGLMITGDHVLFDISPNITVWGTVEDALGEYLDSLEAIKVYPVKQSLPGHRSPGDFHARIDRLIAHHQSRLEEILDIIVKNPGSTGHDIASKMKWRIRAASWEAFPYTQKVFAVGECMSHLDYLSCRGKLKIDKEDGVSHYYVP